MSKLLKMIIGICVLGFIFLLFHMRQIPEGKLLSCSSDNVCAYIATLNGGATTAYYNWVYIKKSDKSSKILLLGIDKVPPSLVKLTWNSADSISIVVPSCSLVINKSKENYPALVVSEQGDEGLMNCKIY